MLTNTEIDNYIDKGITARRHKVRNEAYSKLFDHAFTGGTFTKQQWDAIWYEDNYEEQLRRHVAFLDPSRCNPSAPMAATLAREYADNVKAASWFTMYPNENTLTPMMTYFDLFPHHAKSLAKHAVTVKMIIDCHNFNALKRYMTPDEAARLLPYNIRTIQAIVEHYKEHVQSHICTLFRSLVKKEMPPHKGSEIEAAANIYENLDDENRSWLIKNFTDIFTPVKGMGKPHGRKMLSISFSNFILLLKKAPDNLVTTAVRTLSVNGWQHQRHQLFSEFTIPPEETGTALCHMIQWLDNIDNKSMEKIRGLPSVEEFRAKTIEVQISQQAFFDESLNALQRLTLKTKGMKTHSKEFVDRITTIAGEHNPIESMLQALATIHTSTQHTATILLCLSDAMRDRMHHIPAVMINNNLWLRPPNEEEAAELLKILDKTRWANPQNP